MRTTDKLDNEKYFTWKRKKGKLTKRMSNWLKPKPPECICSVWDSGVSIDAHTDDERAKCSDSATGHSTEEQECKPKVRFRVNAQFPYLIPFPHFRLRSLKSYIRSQKKSKGECWKHTWLLARRRSSATIFSSRLRNWYWGKQSKNEILSRNIPSPLLVNQARAPYSNRSPIFENWIRRWPTK